MTQLLIVNANVVNEGQIQQQDLLIKNGRIEKLSKSLSAENNIPVLDAAGKLLIPGMIDDQVHFRDPGLTHKGDVASESKAAIAGGITSFMEMPNTKPITDTQAAIENKCQNASEKSWGNYAFYLGATHHNLSDIESIDINSVCGVKVFMGASTGNMLVDEPSILEKIFANCPVLIATHCEHTPTVQARQAEMTEKYGADIPMSMHPVIRSHEACLKSSTMAVDLAKRFGTKLHVLHLTTKDELALFSEGDIDHKQITAEVCVHHLFFNEENYAEKDTLIKCNPAIKSAIDQTALQQALKNNVLDIVATDHAPHTMQEKQQPYAKAAAGLPLVQFALPTLFDLYHQGVLSLEEIVTKTSHNVAKRFEVKDRGFIREGYWADLAIVDLENPQPVTSDIILSKCAWSPFTGHTFKSRITHTIVNGHTVYNEGQFHSQGPIGKRLEFSR